MGREQSAEAPEGNSQSPGPPAEPPGWTQPAGRPDSGRGLRGRRTHTQEGEGQAGTAGEGGLPTSDPADGGHMAAASQIKRLRLGGSAITAV